MNANRIPKYYAAGAVALLCLLGCSLSATAVSADRDSYSGAVQGRVVATDSRAALPGASVRITGTTRAVKTDSTGYFSFTDLHAGSYDIEVTHVGYETESARAELDRRHTVVSVDFALFPATIPLRDITVSPGRFTIMESHTAVRQTLSRQDIETIPQLTEDVYRAVARLPGIASTDYSARFTVRGGEHDQVLVRLDGLELYEPFHLKEVDGGALSVIDVAAIDGVDLMTGGFSAEYGNRMSGVFNMRTRTPPPGRGRLAAGLSLGAVRALSEGTFAAHRGAWLVSVRRGYLETITGLTEEYRGVDPRYYDILGKVTWQSGANHLLSVHFLNAGDRLDYDQDGDIAFNEYDGAYAWWRLQSRVSSTVTAETIGSIGSVDHTRRGSGYTESSQTNQFFVDDVRDLDFAGLQQRLDWGVSKRILLTGGVDLRRERSTYDYWSLQRNRYTSPFGGYDYREDEVTLDHARSGHLVGAWLSGRVQPTEPVTIESGVRYDQVSYSGDRLVSPRLGLAAAVADGTSIRAAWGKYYQPQRQYELDIADGDDRFYPAQLAEHFVVGIEQQSAFGVDVRLEAYYKRLSNLKPEYRNWLYPLQLFPEAYLDRVRINLERGASRGIELYLKRDPGATFSWWASYALAWVTERVLSYDVDGGRTAVNDDLPGVFDQRHTLYIDCAYRPTPAWQINLAWHFHSGLPYTDGRIERVGVYHYWVNDEINGERYPAYHRLDLRINRYINTAHGRLAFFVEVINLYDRENVRTYEYDITLSEDRTELFLHRSELHWLGILPSVGIRWQMDW